MSSKTYHIKLNGKVYEVEIEEVKEGQTPQPTVKAEATQKAQPAKQNTSQGGESVTAPMPGSMFNILVKEGQMVKKGDVVAVLEAMKMENEIIAPVDGKIVSVDVSKGQNVNLGDVILKIA